MPWWSFRRGRVGVGCKTFLLDVGEAAANARIGRDLSSAMLVFRWALLYRRSGRRTDALASSIAPLRERAVDEPVAPG